MRFRTPLERPGATAILKGESQPLQGLSHPACVFSFEASAEVTVSGSQGGQEQGPVRDRL